MKEFRFRPMDDYIQRSDWKAIYVLTEHWQSDFYFYTDEINFLNGLFTEFYLLMVGESKRESVQQLANDLLALGRKCESLSQDIQKHLSDIALLMENAFSRNEQDFREDHQRLEDEISRFVKDFRSMKREVFAIASKAIEKGRLAHLLEQ